MFTRSLTNPNESSTTVWSGIIFNFVHFLGLGTLTQGSHFCSKDSIKECSLPAVKLFPIVAALLCTLIYDRLWSTSNWLIVLSMCHLLYETQLNLMVVLGELSLVGARWAWWLFLIRIFGLFRFFLEGLAFFSTKQWMCLETIAATLTLNWLNLRCFINNVLEHQVARCTTTKH